MAAPPWWPCPGIEALWKACYLGGLDWVCSQSVVHCNMIQTRENREIKARISSHEVSRLLLFHCSGRKMATYDHVADELPEMTCIYRHDSWRWSGEMVVFEMVQVERLWNGYVTTRPGLHATPRNYRLGTGIPDAYSKECLRFHFHNCGIHIRSSRISIRGGGCRLNGGLSKFPY